MARWGADLRGSGAQIRAARPPTAIEQARPAATTPAPLLPDLSKPIGERLNSALDHSHPFESAARALAVIDAMTAADFLELAAKPKSLPVPSSSSGRFGFTREFKGAFVDALVARWFAVDPDHALLAIQKVAEALKGREADGALPLALARLRPELLLGALPENASWNRLDTSIPTAFKTLAKNDPAAARGFLSRIGDPDQRKAAAVAIGKGIAEHDPLAAVALARTQESRAIFEAALAAADRAGGGMLHNVLVANGQKFPIGLTLPGLVLRHPEEDWATVLGDAENAADGIEVGMLREAERLSPEERASRLALADRLPPGLRKNMEGLLVSLWASDDPRAATEWGLAHAQAAEDASPGSVRYIAGFSRWMQSDQAAALAWRALLPASPLRNLLDNSAAGALVGEGKIDQAQALFVPLPGPEAAWLLSSIAAGRAKQNPKAAALWLDSLPAETDRSYALKAVVEKWVALDPVAAADWVEAQPAGVWREAALDAYTRSAAQRDPNAAGEWAATITDPAARAKAIEYVFHQMNTKDPAAARTWLRAFPGLETDWRERVIRLHP